MTTNQKYNPHQLMIPTGKILKDERYQVRKKLDKATIEKYERAYGSGTQLPPIEVFKRNEAYVLLSGWHRLSAQMRLGWSEVEAVMLDITEREAVWYAAKSNLTHGLPLKSGEIRAVFKQYISARKHINTDGTLRSYREIAKDLGGWKSYGTVRNWMKQDFPKVFQQYGGDEGLLPEGGLREKATLDTPKEAAKHSINNTLAAYHSTSCPKERGEIVELLEAALSETKSSGNWNPVEFY